MTSEPPDGAAALRERAGSQLRDSDPRFHLDAEAADGLIHELRVHEVELQLQNDELRRIQHDLELARDEYRDLFEEAPVSLVTLDRHGAIVEANQCAGALLQQEVSALAGQPLSRFVVASDAAAWALHVRGMLAGSSLQRCELRLQRRQGEPFPVQLVSVSLARGERICRTAIVDLVDLRRAEQHERDLAAIVEASGDAILSASMDGEILSWNPAAEGLFGYSAAEAVGRSLGLLAPTAQEGSQYLQWDRVWNGERNLRQLSTCRHKDGRPLHLALAIAPMPDALRGTTRIAIVVRDIGEQLEKEGALRRLATVVTDSYDAITVQDLAGRFLSWNYGAQRMYGYSEREAQELTVFDLTPEGAREGLRQVYARLERSGEAGVVVESQRLARDGRVIEVLVTASLLIDDKGQPGAIATTERDIGERKRLEAKTRQSQKMEALGRLASGVAHDFNNFLMGIIGCAELAAQDLGDRPARRYLDEIRRAALRSADVVSQLLSFGRKQPAAPSVFELDRAIDEASTMIRTLLRDDIALTVDLQTAPRHVRCDRGELERAVLNLVVNAREALPGGGTLRIQTRAMPLEVDGPPDGRDGSGPPEQLVLSVIDDGCGMDAETKSRAFEPFFSGKPENTGLGLAMVYGLIQQSGGQIEIESAEGRGTAINVSLPVVDPVPISPPGDEIGRLAGRPVVLVVEDDPLVRLTLRSQVESSGCELIEAPDGAVALACCEQRLAAIDLLITDVILPGMSGPQLARELRERWPDLPVIYISAHAPEALRREGRIGPAERSLQKPFERATLLAAIREALGDDRASG